MSMTMSTVRVPSFDRQMSSLSERLKQLRQESGRLFPKGYTLLDGLSPSRHKLAYKFADDHPELVARLERKFPRHPRDINWEKADKYAGSTLVRHCHDIVQSLKSAYAFFEDLVLFKNQAVDLLQRIHQNLGPISFKDGPNEIVSDWMALFCDLVCLFILAQKIHKEKIIQIYAAAYYAQKRQDPPCHEAVCTMVTKYLSNSIQQLQQDMLDFSLRISQILEYIVCPILSRFDSTLSICLSGVLSLSKPAEVQDGQAGDLDFGITKPLLLKYLMDRKTLERWVIFGALVCPDICSSPTVRACLTNTLSRGHHLQIYRDIHEPIYALFRESIYEKLVQLYKEEKAHLLLITNQQLQHADTETIGSKGILSTSASWREARSELLNSRQSIGLQRTVLNQRSFIKKMTSSSQTEKPGSQSCKSLGSVLTNSFSFSEQSAGRLSEEYDAVLRENRHGTDSGQHQSDDFKTKKLKAKREIRELINVAEEEAQTRGHARREAGWIALRHAIQDVLSAAEAQKDVMVYELDVFLTVLSLATEEVIWEFVRCHYATIPQKKRETFHFKEKILEAQRSKKIEDLEVHRTVGGLMEATVQLQILLLSHRSSICHHRVHMLQAQFMATSSNLHSVMHTLEQRQIAVDTRLMSHLQSMEQCVDAIHFQSPFTFDSEDDTEDEDHTSIHLVSMEDEFWVWDELSEMRSAWKYIELAMSDVESPVNIGVLLDAGCDDTFLTYKQVLMDLLNIGNFVETISRRSPLKEIAFYEAQVHQIIRNNFTESSTIDNSFNGLSLLHVFAQFYKNDIWGDDPFKKTHENEYIEVAERCGVQLVVLLEDFLKDLIVKCTAVGQTRLPHVLELTAYWVSNLGSFGIVEVVPSFVFDSVDFLQNTLVNTLKDILADRSLQDDGVHGFQHVRMVYVSFLELMAELQGMVDVDILSSVYSSINGLINHREQLRMGSSFIHHESLASDGEATPFHEQTNSVFSDQALVSLLADVMATSIIRDPRNLCIIFDPRRKKFIRKDSDARPEMWTGVGCSLEDLRSLISIFGVVGVKLLETQFRTLIYESIGKMNDYLCDHENMLNSMTAAFASERECINGAVLSHLAKQLSNLPALVDITLQFSRSLIVRHLLSEAYTLQITQKDTGQSKRQKLSPSQLGLPEVLNNIKTFPSSLEPAMVDIFKDLFHSGQLDRWMYIPALFSCLVHEMTPTARSFNPESRTFSNGMHQIISTLNSIALAIEAVASETSDHGGRRERMERASPSMFHHQFAKSLVLFTLRSEEKHATISNICLLLSSVCSEVLACDQLEEIGLSEARAKSALASAYKRHVMG